MVCVIDKVIESAEFASEIRGVCRACEALGFGNGKRLDGRSATSGEPEVPDPGCVARKAEEVDVTLSSFAEMDFTRLFRLGELDYDGFL